MPPPGPAMPRTRPTTSSPTWTSWSTTSVPGCGSFAAVSNQSYPWAELWIFAGCRKFCAVLAEHKLRYSDGCCAAELGATLSKLLP